jgi:hypothetical protein
MPVSYAEARNIVFLTSAVRGRSLFTEKKKHMSRTIKAIQRHMTPLSKREAVEPHAPKLVGEWQQRGPETLSGYALRKLRLGFAPSQSTKLATVNR